MVRVTLIILFTFNMLLGTVYEKNCVSCHNTLPVGIDKYFYRYLLKYSSQTKVKEAMVQYLNNPSKTHTIMPEAFVSRFGIKKPTTLSPQQLQQAIDTYWETYKIFGKLK